MPGREILQLGNPLLLQTSSRIEDFSASATQSLIQDLSDTLASFREATGYGRGIAAPQIGRLQRAIFIRMQPVGFCSALLNPEMIWVSDQKMQLWDDCFSFPDLLVRVERAVQVKVAYTDDKGLPQMIEAEGDLAELLQHEIDHLDGILAVERAISPKAFSTRREWQRQLKR
jgi:peptide deformylase